jgi:hypothetical protein
MAVIPVRVTGITGSPEIPGGWLPFGKMLIMVLRCIRPYFGKSVKQIEGNAARFRYDFDQQHVSSDISDIRFDEQKWIITPETKF